MNGWVLLDWLVIAAACLGHAALHLVIYNRLNATGLPRWLIKLIKYFFMGTFVLLPVAVWWHDGEALATAMRDSDRVLPALALGTRLYGLLCLGTLAVFGPDWLRSRPSLNRDAVDVPTRARRYRVDTETAQPLPRTLKCRLFASLPLNQMFQLAVEEKELAIERLPSQLEGLKVAHLSDVHLTGHVDPAYYRFVMDRAVSWKPDLIALTGDVIDKAKCIDWLGECFAVAEARHGCYFVLGNHDLRVRDPRVTRSELSRHGWIDLGGQQRTMSVRGVPLRLIGNESPWFPAPRLEPTQEDEEEPQFRLLLSHSPDQIGWARRHNIDLMLAGHTHGGQGRLPWIGPVLSPSYYGSRYASGTFYLAPSLMHVTRGLSGVHLMRIHCPPELALLTLRKGR